MKKYWLVATTLKGLEIVLADEVINELRLKPKVLNRAVSFEGGKSDMYRANLKLRTAIRILKPILHFTAKSADELYEKLKIHDWESFMRVSDTFSIDAVVHSEEFRHSQFVIHRAKDAVADHFFEKYNTRPSVRITRPIYKIHIHIDKNTCNVYLDSSGESLHKRGYRIAPSPAPLNEVLAAGMILLSGWKSKKPFIDPMCGSGTLLIEAAMIANNIPPGLYRKEFGFERWNDFDKELWEEIFDETDEIKSKIPIVGCDISQLAIDAARKNIENAGLQSKIELHQATFQSFTPNLKRGIIVTNPPYGERMRVSDIESLYNLIGSRLKHHFTGFEAWILSNSKLNFNAIGLRPSQKIMLHNGDIECQFQQYELYEGSKKIKKQPSKRQYQKPHKKWKQKKPR